MRRLLLTLLLIGLLAPVAVALEDANFQNEPVTDWIGYHSRAGTTWLLTPVSGDDAGCGHYDQFFGISTQYWNFARSELLNANPFPSSQYAVTYPYFHTADAQRTVTIHASAADGSSGWVNSYSSNVTLSGSIPENCMRFVVKRESGYLYFYAGGNVLVDRSDLPMLGTPIYWFANGGNDYVSLVPLDDPAIGPNDDDGIVGIMPNDWFIAENVVDGGLSGLYRADGTSPYSHEFHASYAIPEGENDGTWTLSIDGDEQPYSCPEYIPNLTMRGTDNADHQVKQLSGFVTFDIDAFVAANDYGRHTVVLKHGATVVESEDFYFTGDATGSTSIAFDRETYVMSDEVQITTIIDDYMWDGMAAEGVGFEARLYDSEMSSCKETWDVTTQTHIHDTAVTTDDFPATGTYMVALYAKTDDPATPEDEDSLLTTDTAYVYADKIIYCGYVYDAYASTEANVIELQGVAVTLAQGGSTYTATTNDSGYFEVTGATKDLSTDISFTKTGYHPHNYTTTFLEYKRYCVEIGLIPNSAPYEGAAIQGVVYNAANLTPVEGATVTLLNDGSPTGLTTTTDEFGYYCINNTDEAEDYQLNSTASRYRGYQDAIPSGRAAAGVYYADPAYQNPIFTLGFRILNMAYPLSPGTLIADRDMTVQSEVISTAYGSQVYNDLTVNTGSKSWTDVDWGAYSYSVNGANTGTTTGEGYLIADTIIDVPVQVNGPPVATTVPTTTATTSTADVVGRVYNATDWTQYLPGASVTLKQSGLTRTCIANATGWYNFSDIAQDTTTTMNVSLAGYHHEAFDVYPHGYSAYTWNLYPWPDNRPDDWTIEPGAAGMSGVLVDHFYQPITDGYVFVDNATWNGSIPNWQTGTNVFWLEDLAPETAYSALGNKTGYENETEPFTTGPDDSWKEIRIVLGGAYTVLVHVHKASDVTAYVQTTARITISTDPERSANSTAGVATFPEVLFGTYTFTATASGYRDGGTQDYIYRDDQVVDIFMESSMDASGEISYSVPPHNVRFITQNFMGVPLSGVGVTAIGTTTTVPDRGIFDAIFGWTDKYSNASLTNTSMTDTTSSDGSVVFLMTELMKYEVTFAQPGGGENQTVTLYPQESIYVITMGDRPFAEPDTPVNMTVWADTPEGADATLHVAYDDTAARTTSVRFIVRNETGYDLHNETHAEDSFTDDYTANHTTGAMYVWGVVADHQDYGRIEKWNGVTLHSRLIDLGLEDVYYTWISIAAIIMFAAIFSGQTSKYGWVLLPIFAGILKYIGWLPASWLVVVSALAVGVIASFIRGQGV